MTYRELETFTSSARAEEVQFVLRAVGIPTRIRRTKIINGREIIAWSVAVPVRLWEEARQVLDEDLLPAKFDFTGKSTEPDRKFIPPPRFEEMIEISRRISEGFDYVRVDLYNLDGRIVFGEITPFHAGGLLTIAPRSWDYQLGRRWGGDPSRVAGREGSP